VLLLAAKLAAPPLLRTVTLDVKDGEIHAILKSIQKQCGIRNLAIDPGVTGGGTFVFHDVPCTVAIDTVLRVNGLRAGSYSGAVVAVRHR
jgi:hypothetical protein